MYADFAQVYDRLMQDVDYEGWASYYQSLLEKAGIKRGARVTECACGTGNFSTFLCQDYELTGVDLSEEMLSVAAAKLRMQAKRVPLIRQDMKRLTLQKPQDAILATCDGVNYLLDEKSLQEFFKAVYRYLHPGGVLLFDVSSYHKISETLGDNTLFCTQGDVHYIWHNAWDASKRILDMELHFYVRQQQTRFKYLFESQRQRAWLPDELKALLGEAGFCEICLYGDKTYTEPDEKSPRHHILAQKSLQ